MRNPTERGVLYYNPDTPNIQAFVPAEIQTGELAEFNATTTASLDYIDAGFAQNASRYQPEHAVAENKRLAAASISALRQQIEIARSVARAVAEDDARSIEPKATFDPMYEASFVNGIKGLPIGEQSGAVANLSYAASSALIRNGDLYRLGLPDAMIDAVLETHRIEAHLARSGIRANYPRQPTLSDPLAIGVDEKAARAATVAAVQRLQQRRENIELAAETIRSICRYIAANTGQSPEVVWASIAA